MAVAVLCEYHCLESNFGLTSVQTENNCSLPKVYTASLLKAYTHEHKLGTHRITISQNRTE